MDEEPYLKDDDLKPCPFCGGEASVSLGSQGPDQKPWWYIECCDCSASADAVEVWNRRTPPEALRIPEGWRLVPEKPTEEMLLAGYWNDETSNGTQEEAYRAMLNAAPQAQRELATSSGPAVAAPATLPRDEFLRLSVEDAMEVLERYPNLRAMLQGCVSGHSREWPMLRTELQILLYSIHAHTQEIKKTIPSPPRQSDEPKGLPPYPLAHLPGCSWPACECTGRWSCNAREPQHCSLPKEK